MTAPIRKAGHAVRTMMMVALPIPRAQRRARSAESSLRRRNPPWLDEEGGGGSGVREPRRPKPNPPVGAMALKEPSERDVVRGGGAIGN